MKIPLPQVMYSLRQIRSLRPPLLPMMVLSLHLHANTTPSRVGLNLMFLTRSGEALKLYCVLVSQ